LSELWSRQIWRDSSENYCRWPKQPSRAPSSSLYHCWGSPPYLLYGADTAANWQAGLEEEIASAKAIELEALYERAYLAKEQRIRMLARELRAIRAEIMSRGPEDVPTRDLLKL
jgi:hypothetical protein